MTCKLIAVHHKDTGVIKQVVYCAEEDVDKQHLLFRDHTFVEVEPDTHPNEHAIDVKTGKRIAKQRDLEHERARLLTRIEALCEAAIRQAMLSKGDFLAARDKHLSRLDEMRMRIKNAPDLSSLDAVTWDGP